MLPKIMTTESIHHQMSFEVGGILGLYMETTKYHIIMGQYVSFEPCRSVGGAWLQRALVT